MRTMLYPGNTHLQNVFTGTPQYFLTHLFLHLFPSRIPPRLFRFPGKRLSAPGGSQSKFSAAKIMNAFRCDGAKQQHSGLFYPNYIALLGMYLCPGQ